MLAPAGLRPSHTLRTGLNLNGGGIALFPPLDAIQEFWEATSVPDARYDRGGGGTVNLVFRPGTDEFYRNVFEFLRNSVLKTLNGAALGDLFMSLIHTCELNGANPFAYLTELQRYAEELKRSPSEWMPWNYRETLARLATPTAA
jgi:hypothetical protein